MNVVVYTRVSSEEQVEKYGLAAQRDALRALACQRGYTIVAEAADEGISGTVADRPGIARVRDPLRSGKADGVLVYDLSRLGREAILALTVLNDLHACGKLVEFLARPSEDTPDGKMLNTIEATFAERERSKLIERTKAGKAAKARAGIVPCGPYPFGYRPEQPGKGGTYTQPGGLCVVEDEAKLVRQLYAWAEEGISIRQMAVRLAASGTKPRRGGAWSKPTITKLLRNPCYKGEYIRNRVAAAPKGQPEWVRVARPESEWTRFAVTPLVSPVTWESAQACFERNRSRLVGRPDNRNTCSAGSSCAASAGNGTSEGRRGADGSIGAAGGIPSSGSTVVWAPAS